MPSVFSIFMPFSKRKFMTYLAIVSAETGGIVEPLSSCCVKIGMCVVCVCQLTPWKKKKEKKEKKKKKLLHAQHIDPLGKLGKLNR